MARPVGLATHRPRSRAKLTSVDQEADLRCVPERISDHPINSIAELPPWNVRLDAAAGAPG